MENKITFSEQLKARRKAAGLTPLEAAKAEGVSVRLWAYWEAGEKLPPTEKEVVTQEKILARVGVKPELS
jgi:transcriptional regulator with XRE-family HTH domain